MRKHAQLLLIPVLLVITSLFTACGQEDKELADAFIKNQEILSLESTNDIIVNLGAEGLDEESQVIFDTIAHQINGMKLSLKQKSVTNKNQTIARSQIDAKATLEDEDYSSSIWVDMNMDSDKFALKEVFKLPSDLMSLILNAEDKEYIVLDYDNMNEFIAGMEQDMPEQMNLDRTMDIAMKYQKRFTNAFIDYIKNYSFNDSFVTRLRDQDDNENKIKYYQVKFDNHSFKKFLKYTITSILEDENIIPLFEEYMDEIMAASGEELSEEISIFGESKKMVESAKRFFDAIEDLQILGEDGIDIIFGVNSDGYIVSEAGKIDLIIDTKQIMDLMPVSAQENELLEAMTMPTFEVSILYDNKINNINQDLEITMPIITQENSIDYIDLIQAMIPENQGSNELIVIIEDELVEFTNNPILVNDRYLVSTKDIAKELGADITWDADTKEITIKKDKDVIKFDTRNKKLFVNEGVQSISIDIVVDEGGVSYVPLRTIAENLGYTLDWHQELKMMVVYK